MNSLVLLLICVAILIVGYICYGGWLCKQWGVGDSKTETPAHTMEDGVDYVPAKAPVLMGHHFSSIAGAGPITGPIGAAMFGWLPVTLWSEESSSAAFTILVHCSLLFVTKDSLSERLSPLT